MKKPLFNKTKILMAVALVGIGALLMLTSTGGDDQIPEDNKQTKANESESLYSNNTNKGTGEVQWPKAMEVPAKTNGIQELLLKRDAFWVSYNKDRKIPNWVAWHLTAAHTRGNNQRDDMLFTEDSEVPYPRATDDDYYSSHYDRGHMCPAGDNKWDRRALTQSFKFSNICPQNHSLNKGDWNDLEIQCRYWAREMGDIYIVTGPIFYNGVKKTIGRNQVAVPDAFFKVVLCDNGKAKAIGFIYPNRGGHKEMKEYVRSVDEIERITGIDFFPKLEDSLEGKLESATKDNMVNQWKVYLYKPSNYDPSKD